MLFNFARPSKDIPGLGNDRPDICYQFASLKDGEKEKSLTACGGEERLNILHVSESHIIQISFANPTLLQTLGAYLLKYEGMYYNGDNGISQYSTVKNLILLNLLVRSYVRYPRYI